MNNEVISRKNMEFWNEMCGSKLPDFPGITYDRAESLKGFYDWYFIFYPYLFNHIPFDSLKGKDVFRSVWGAQPYRRNWRSQAFITKDWTSRKGWLQWLITV